MSAINLNLLPWRESERLFKNNIFYGILALVILLGLGTALGFQNLIILLKDRQNNTNALLNTEISILRKNLGKFIDIETEQKRLTERVGTIRRLQANRVFNVLLFNTLAEITPPKMVLSNVIKTNDKLKFVGFIQESQAATQFLKSLIEISWIQDSRLGQISNKFTESFSIGNTPGGSSQNDFLKFDINTIFSEKIALEELQKQRDNKN